MQKKLSTFSIPFLLKRVCAKIMSHRAATPLLGLPDDIRSGVAAFFF